MLSVRLALLTHVEREVGVAGAELVLRRALVLAAVSLARVLKAQAHTHDLEEQCLTGQRHTCCACLANSQD